jgi:uncharacterized membrane protein
MVEILPNWHPVFVHFTVSLLALAAALHLLTHFLPKGELANQLTIVARWNLWIGVGFTLLTVAAGWHAFYTVNHDTLSHLAMIEHRNWAMVTFVLFLGIAGWEVYLSRRGKGKGWLFTGLLVIAAGLLLSTAWHGAELVYRHGLGVMSMPKPEGSGHAHEHGDMPMQSEAAPHKDVHRDAAAKAEPPHQAVPGGATPAADPAGTTPMKTGHVHAQGTKPHKD